MIIVRRVTLPSEIWTVCEPLTVKWAIFVSDVNELYWNTCSILSRVMNLPIEKSSLGWLALCQRWECCVKFSLIHKTQCCPLSIVTHTTSTNLGLHVSKDLVRYCLVSLIMVSTNKMRIINTRKVTGNWNVHQEQVRIPKSTFRTTHGISMFSVVSYS